MFDTIGDRPSITTPPTPSRGVKVISWIIVVSAIATILYLLDSGFNAIAGIYRLVGYVEGTTDTRRAADEDTVTVRLMYDVTSSFVLPSFLETVVWIDNRPPFIQMAPCKKSLTSADNYFCSVEVQGRRGKHKVSVAYRIEGTPLSGAHAGDLDFQVGRLTPPDVPEVAPAPAPRALPQSKPTPTPARPPAGRVIRPRGAPSEL